jgi:hypothetical protein
VAAGLKNCVIARLDPELLHRLKVRTSLKRGTSAHEQLGSSLEELERDELLAATGPKRNIFKVTRKGYEIADRLV